MLKTLLTKHLKLPPAKQTGAMVIIMMMLVWLVIYSVFFFC